jgi:hypothetical protein
MIRSVMILEPPVDLGVCCVASDPAGAPKMTTQAKPCFDSEPVFGLILLILPWISLLWYPLFVLWLFLVFLLLFLIPAVGRMRETRKL